VSDAAAASVNTTSLLVATNGSDSDWIIVAMDRVAAPAGDGAGSTVGHFRKTLYYVANAGRRGLPMEAMRWWAVDAGGLQSTAAGMHFIGVSCPHGHQVNASDAGLSPVGGMSWQDPTGLARHNMSSAALIPGSCIECGAGTFSPLVDSATCANCKAGTFSSGRARYCTACPLNYYSDVEGTAACTSCPTNREGDQTATSITLNLASQSKTECVCPRAGRAFISSSLCRLKHFMCMVVGALFALPAKTGESGGK
jgi:hypothetical protein